MSETSSTQASSTYEDDITQEVRFAVVFYGGVSLCVYMGGVAQELLSLVRSTANLPGPLTPTERIYRELGQFLYASRDNQGEKEKKKEIADACDNMLHPRVRTRFVVDILTGSSAGGINAIALAKALALKLPDLAPLITAWRDEAHLDQLLNGPPKTGRLLDGRTIDSLLDGDKMYNLCYGVIDELNGKTPTATAGTAGLADEIDLFVTATDLIGLYSPIRLADRYLHERIHKTVFRFRYRDPWVEKICGTSTTPLNQFEKEFDQILAFAARCTSSFPLAFAPSTWGATGGEEPAGKEIYKGIFRLYRGAAGDDATGRPIELGSRLFGDGGSVDPRPFSYAIEQIRFRTARRPTQRKLLFVDPFPERIDPFPERMQSVRKINFLENLVLQASGLPRHDAIRTEIEAVNASNRLQDRLDTLWDSAKSRAYAGPSAAYHHLRVSETTDAIARLLALAADFDPDFDECFFIRQIVRVWRSNYYKPKPPPNEPSEKQFLETFDVDFELRRLNRVAWRLDEELQKTQKSAHERRKCLRKARLIVEQALQYMRLQLRNIRAELALDELKKLKKAISLEEFRFLITQAELGKRHKAAQDFYRNHEDEFRAVGQKLIEKFCALRDEFDKKHGSVDAHIRHLSHIASETYDEFEQWDEIALPLLAGTGVREFTRADVYCIGPAEGKAFRPLWLGTDIKERPLNAKLKGTAFMDFGAFMSPEWRRNDLMWGRLDAAEKLVRILLPLERDADGQPHPKSIELQEKYISCLREAILEEELDGNYYVRWARERLGITTKGANSDAVEKVTELVSNIPFLKKAIMGEGDNPRSNFIMNYYDEPRHPQSKEYSDWIGRSLTILGWMIEDSAHRSRAPTGAVAAHPRNNDRSCRPFFHAKHLPANACPRLGLAFRRRGYRALAGRRTIFELASLVGARNNSRWIACRRSAERSERAARRVGPGALAGAHGRPGRRRRPRPGAAGAGRLRGSWYLTLRDQRVATRSGRLRRVRLVHNVRTKPPCLPPRRTSAGTSAGERTLRVKRPLPSLRRCLRKVCVRPSGG